MSPYEVETIARVAHAANKEHCKVFNDFSHRDWEDCTEAQRESIRSGVRFLVDNPDAGPDAQHNAWLADKEVLGWTYGPEKDIAKKLHPCMKPWKELPDHQRMKDVLFASVVRGLLKGLK